ncbi:MAG TPA: hypothetical protein VIO64_06730 [Pseudobacteroides sp.]|uniref:hypothetical protein n=1 Tax=Pseudobacteroides sp. TaxID=1968840 RepID=UPI002F945387
MLKNIPTSIKLADCATLPTGLSGTTLFNWNSSQIFDYIVLPILTINSANTIPTPGPTSTPIKI